MLEPAHLRVLGEIVARLGEGVDWAVTGSLGFVLQGVPVRPGDIDLQTGRAGAYEIERRFAGYVMQPVRFSTAGRIRSHFGALTIDGLRVEIMGDVQKRLKDGGWENPVDVRPHRRFVDVGELRVRVLALEYEREAYRQLGRTARADMLERWLRGGRTISKGT